MPYLKMVRLLYVYLLPAVLSVFYSADELNLTAEDQPRDQAKAHEPQQSNNTKSERASSPRKVGEIMIYRVLLSAYTYV